MTVTAMEMPVQWMTLQNSEMSWSAPARPGRPRM
jgi:hypothetical protein